MEFAGLLVKVFGVYALVLGAFMLFKRDAAVELMKSFKRSHTLARFTGALELLIGLFLVLGFPSWQGTELAVSVLGIAALAEGAFYLFSTPKTVSKVVSTFTSPRWYYLTTVIMLLVGVYFLDLGFGLF